MACGRSRQPARTLQASMRRETPQGDLANDVIKLAAMLHSNRCANGILKCPF